MSWNRLWIVLDRLTTVAMLAAAGTVVWIATSASASRANPGVGNRASVVEGVLSPALIARSSAKGQANAKWAIVEFSDYQCPYCARHANEVFPELDKEFVSTGKIKYLFLNFPLTSIHPHAIAAAQAAECAGAQTRYWDMHDQLFRNQKAIPQRRFADYGKAIGLEMPTFEDCMSKSAKATISDDESLGKRFGVQSTPTFLIGQVEKDGSIRLERKVTGMMPYPDFKTILNDVMH